MATSVDHVCVADHCVSCCPTAQGYSAGFADAKSFYSTENAMRMLDGNPLLYVVLVALIILAWQAVTIHKLRNTHVNAID